MSGKLLRCSRSPTVRLALLAVLSWIVYLAITLLSRRFEFNSERTGRPIVLVLILFATAFGCYLAAIRITSRWQMNRSQLALVVVAGVVFRATMLFSTPIQEIDIYRYLWDGEVLSLGVSPFRYSPDQVQSASLENPLPEDLARLVNHRDRRPALAIILSRIHYGRLPTIYPPVSQLVFAAAAWTTPRQASVSLRITVMKTWLAAFDLATLVLVIAFVSQAGKPTGQCLIYAWCPLLIKEIANSGHLDAIAIFLTMLAIYLALGALWPGRQCSESEPKAERNELIRMTLAMFVLALGVGAKIYPIVLAPLILGGFVWRSFSQRPWLPGLARSAVPGVVFLMTAWLVLAPILPSSDNNTQARDTQDNLAGKSSFESLTPPIPNDATAVIDPSLGLTTFLRHWEINDFLFLILIENIKPMDHQPANRVAWFSILPESLRLKIIQTIRSRFELKPAEIPFLVARMITAAAFLVTAIWFVWRTRKLEDIESWLQAAFLTLAWFWLLCPTQNPWYWLWALPLLPFARGRAWLAVGGIVFLYYLRFWFRYHWPDSHVLGTPYTGTEFFDFYITWLEFLPWFVWLAVEYFRDRHKAATQTSFSATNT